MIKSVLFVMRNVDSKTTKPVGCLRCGNKGTYMGRIFLMRRLCDSIQNSGLDYKVVCFYKAYTFRNCFEVFVFKSIRRPISSLSLSVYDKAGECTSKTQSLGHVRLKPKK